MLNEKFYIEGINGMVFDSRNKTILYAKNELELNEFVVSYDNRINCDVIISGENVYRISSTNESSNKLGNCEVCNNHATEMYHQVEAKVYSYNGNEGLTYHNCTNYFGHKDCLQSKMKGLN